MLSPTGLRLSPAGGVNNFQPVRIPIINASGAAMVQYGVYQLDIGQTASGVTTDDLGIANAIAVATAGIACGLLCVVQTALAAAASGWAVIAGPTKLVTDNSAILKGSALKPVNASAKVSLATTGTDRFHWIAQDVNGSVDSTIINALMFGPFGTR